MAAYPRRKTPRYRDLADYIERSGDSQQNLANALNTTPAWVSRVVRGLMVPRPEMAERLANYARIPLDSFTRAYLARKRNGRHPAA
jgi:transcriptional regulator with XRE-family HTH domain